MHNESPPSLVKREVGCARRPRLLHRMREALRSRLYSPRTEQTDCLWVRSYIRFHSLRHSGEMSEPEINAFLTHLSTKKILIPRRQGAKNRITILPESLKETLQKYVEKSKQSTSATWPAVGVAFSCRTPSTVNTSTRPENGSGKGSFLRKTAGKTQHFVIPSPRISWKAATTSGPFRNFSVTRTSRRR